MHFDDPVLERHRCDTLEYQAEVLHAAASGAHRRPYVLRPAPAGLIGCPTDGKASEVHQLETHDLGEYIAEEVMPSIEVLRADGFTPHAFAFPGGIEGREIVDALAPHIEITRGITQRPAE